MEIKTNLEDLDKKGIYIIENLINNKFYIGSTSIKFSKRFKHHIDALRRNAHKNQHLQNAYDKYNEWNFQIRILEICEENILEREQYYIDLYDAVNKGYNINPRASGTPNLSKDVCEKRKKTFTKFIRDCVEYKTKINSNELTLEDIPEKYHKMIKSLNNHSEPWNKGKTYESTNHLKVPKKKKGDRSKCIETILNKQPIIQVFDLNNNFLGEWLNSTILSNESLNKEFWLNNHLILRNDNGRNGFPPYYLAKFNIKKSCLHNIPYKGLNFKIKPQ